MNSGFTPIRLEKYVEMHLRSNPGVKREELVRRLTRAMEAARRGARCHCGAPIWILGSAEVGLGCFTCITGDAAPDQDYEIDLEPNERPARQERRQRPGGNPSALAQARPSGSTPPNGSGLKAVARNAPCPCGSGKKYKRCCLAAQVGSARPSGQEQPSPVPRFRFESGSYGSLDRGFMPSALCYEQVAPGQWKEHFCLVNPACCLACEDEASARAKADLDEAFAAQSRGGTDREVAMILRNRGYQQVEDFRRADTGAADDSIPF